MDELISLGSEYDSRFPMMFAPESYAKWQIQNYINHKLSENEKISMIAQILSSVKNEETKLKIEVEFEKFNNDRNSHMQ